MASVTGIHGISFTSGIEELIAIWHKTPIIVSSTAHRRAGPNLTDGQDTYFANFLDKAYMVNGVDGNFAYDGGDWLNITNLDDAPIAKFVKLYSNRLFLYNIKIAGVAYPSRCWFSDYPKNNGITWGLETGTDLAQTAGSAVVTSASASFRTRNIKVGNPLTIITGLNIGEYVVQSVDSEHQITLTRTLGNTASGSSFWVGGNWFDTRTDDGDVGNGLGMASGELILYKKNSAHRYNDQGRTLIQIKNMPGTTSPRSIVEGSDGYCYSYHPSGIWRTKGAVGEEVSDAIIDVIEGVTDANQDNVVGWEVGKRKIKMFLGDVTLRDGDTVSKCVAVLNHQTNQRELESLDRTITCATTWLESNVEKVYAGDSADSVVQLSTGTSFDGTAIPFGLVLHPIFPAGSENLVDFTRLRLYVQNGLDVQVLYRLIYRPMQYKEMYWNIDDNWTSLRGSQRGDRSEWTFPKGARASGVQLKVIESGADESFLLEKIVLYYANASDR